MMANQYGRHAWMFKQKSELCSAWKHFSILMRTIGVCDPGLQTKPFLGSKPCREWSSSGGCTYPALGLFSRHPKLQNHVFQQREASKCADFGVEAYWTSREFFSSQLKCFIKSSYWGGWIMMNQLMDSWILVFAFRRGLSLCLGRQERHRSQRQRSGSGGRFHPLTRSFKEFLESSWAALQTSEQQRFE